MKFLSKKSLVVLNSTMNLIINVPEYHLKLTPINNQ